MKNFPAAIVTFLIGAFVSAGVTWSFMKSSSNESEKISSECLVELEGLRPQVSMLEANLNLMRNALEERMTPEPAATQAASDSAKKQIPISPEPIQSDDDRDAERVFVDWRVKSVSKIVPITDEQKNQLKARFEQESAINRKKLPFDEKSEELAGLPSLESIIGNENAVTYRQHVQAAFARAENDALEKEVIWLGRRLNLTADQESQVRGAFIAAEDAVKARRAQNPQRGNSPQARMQLMIEENELRSNLLRERLKSILTEAQIMQYAKEEADSAAADMSMFHSG